MSSSDAEVLGGTAQDKAAVAAAVDSLLHMNRDDSVRELLDDFRQRRLAALRALPEQRR